MVKYQKCSDLKRTFAFLIDIFIAFLIGVVLFTIPSLIFQQTDSYKNNLETINTIKNESGLFKNDQNLDIYLENDKCKHICQKDHDLASLHFLAYPSCVSLPIP